MTGMGWKPVHWMARGLEPDEREAALGDLAESGAGPATALAAVGGLAARRQAGLWKDWRPWMVLFGIVGPVSAMLLKLPKLDLYLWILRNYPHFDVRMLEQSRLTAGHVLGAMASYALMAALGAWTGGFVLGSLSRRTVWIQVAVFCCVAALGLSAAIDAMSPPRPDVLVGTVAITVLLPLAWGAWQGLRRGALRKSTALLAAAALGSAVACSAVAGRWWHGGLSNIAEILIAVILCWPAGYIVASARRSPKEQS